VLGGKEVEALAAFLEDSIMKEQPTYEGNGKKIAYISGAVSKSCNEFCVQNSGGLQDRYAVLKTVYAVRCILTTLRRTKTIWKSHRLP